MKAMVLRSPIGLDRLALEERPDPSAPGAGEIRVALHGSSLNFHDLGVATGRMCAAEGIGMIPWSPLARGRLTRDWDDTTERSQTDEFGSALYAHTADADRKVVEAVAAIAAERGVPRARVALAWVLAKPEVSAPIIGASKAAHLDDAIAALALGLTEGEIARMEAPYVPHAVVGFS